MGRGKDEKGKKICETREGDGQGLETSVACAEACRRVVVERQARKEARQTTWRTLNAGYRDTMCWWAVFRGLASFHSLW